MQKTKRDLQENDKYIAFGFDMDHCLVRYNIKELFPIIYKSIARILVEQKNYPEEMLEFGKREKCFIMNGLVIDIETGYIFKLGQNNAILRAYYGYDPVSQEDLEEKYGSPPVYSKFNPYKTRTPEYKCCLTFFDCCLSAILAHMIQYKKKLHQESELNIKEIVEDAEHAENANYNDNDNFPDRLPEKYPSIFDFGYFWKTIVPNFDNVAFKQDKTRELLKSLRAKGKILFLASNSVDEYVRLIMEHCFGKDWMTLFDFIIGDAGKPRFFTQNSPFVEIDTSAPNRIGRAVTELRQHGVYARGNAKSLEENILKLNGNKPGRILFFGDNYSTDALAAETIPHWDAVCIMEELGDVDFGEGYDGSYWGHWQYEDTNRGRIPTFWYDYMGKNVAMCTSLVGSMEMASFYES